MPTTAGGVRGIGYAYTQTLFSPAVVGRLTNNIYEAVSSMQHRSSGKLLKKIVVGQATNNGSTKAYEYE